MVFLLVNTKQNLPVIFFTNFNKLTHKKKEKMRRIWTTKILIGIVVLGTDLENVQRTVEAMDDRMLWILVW